MIFYVTSHPGNSSLEHSDKHINELKSYNAEIKEDKVKAISWKRLLLDYSIEKIDLLSLDIEGAEKYVLKDMIDSNVLPDVICIEVGYEWEEKKEILKTIGYRFDFFHYNNAYCSKYNKKIDIEKVKFYFQNEWYWNGNLIYQYEKDKF